nr:DUF4325 domain-containing protein [Vibrio splendidus]MCC4883056.1 DUF4325 domain-containing protein [Vibrio splendidus]
MSFINAFLEKLKHAVSSDPMKGKVITSFDMSDFSDNPSGRYYSDSSSSAELFREEYLMPKLRALPDNGVLLIALDTVDNGYGASFLRDSFASVVEFGYMSADELLNKVKFSCGNSLYGFYADRIVNYVRNAKFDSCSYTPTKVDQ